MLLTSRLRGSTYTCTVYIYTPIYTYIYILYAYIPIFPYIYMYDTKSSESPLSEAIRSARIDSAADLRNADVDRSDPYCLVEAYFHAERV